MVCCPCILISNQIYHQTTSFIARIFQIWLVPVGYGELARGLEPLRSSEIIEINNKKMFVVEITTPVLTLRQAITFCPERSYHYQWCFDINRM